MFPSSTTDLIIGSLWSLCTLQLVHFISGQNQEKSLHRKQSFFGWLPHANPNKHVLRGRSGFGHYHSFLQLQWRYLRAKIPDVQTHTHEQMLAFDIPEPFPHCIPINWFTGWIYTEIYLISIRKYLGSSMQITHSPFGQSTASPILCSSSA